MNVMAQAHKKVQALIAKLSPSARYKGQYAAMLKLALKEAHKEYKAMQTAVTEYATKHLPFPSKLAFSFSGKSRASEVYITERGLMVIHFDQGRVQLKAQCVNEQQAWQEAQRWMSFDK